MATFRIDVHLGKKVPLVETDDLADESVTLDKLSIDVRNLLEAPSTPAPSSTPSPTPTEVVHLVDYGQTGYFVCNSAANSAAKVVEATDFTKKTGGYVHIKMSNYNTADSVTLQIGGSAPSPLYYGGEPAGSGNTWEAGEVIAVFFDGMVYQAEAAGLTPASTLDLDELLENSSIDVKGMVDDYIDWYDENPVDSYSPSDGGTYITNWVGHPLIHGVNNEWQDVGEVSEGDLYMLEYDSSVWMRTADDWERIIV